MTARNSAITARLRARIAATKSACAICGEPINYELKWPHPRSFVVDHIIPLAKGGTHAKENAQAAHADCNSKKRARTVAPIVKRSRSLDW